MIHKQMLLFLFVFFSQTLALAQESVQWGSSQKPIVRRETIEGTHKYYEPEKVEQIGDVYKLSLYRSGTPSAADEDGQYMINCQTREFVNTINGQTTQPSIIIAGEELYFVGKKFCDWDKKGFFKKIFE
jgi:hypothetical protein